MVPVKEIPDDLSGHLWGMEMARLNRVIFIPKTPVPQIMIISFGVSYVNPSPKGLVVHTLKLTTSPSLNPSVSLRQAGATSSRMSR